MMKLRYLYIIFIFSFVSATPYGYGTKGGAIAKAIATSSAFDGPSQQLPVSVPVGSGFSGSFSKSSSSSSSTSSSSASSSSSSFSFSGTSPSNVKTLVINSEKNCEAGGCQSHLPSSGALGKSETSSGINTAATTIDGLQKSDCGYGNCPGTDIVEEIQSYKNAKIPVVGHTVDTQYSGCSFGACHESGANTISGAQSQSVGSLEQVKSDSNTDKSFELKPEFLNKDDQTPSLGCKGFKCNTFDTNYKPNLPGFEKEPSNFASTQKCSSGYCTSNVEKEPINSFHFNTNDFPAKINPEIPVDHSKYNLQKPNVVSESQPGCTSGGCGTFQPNINTALSSSGTHDHNYPSNCMKPDCSLHETSSTSTTIGYKPPATSLEPPKGVKPSSYDVPIHSALNTLQVNYLSSSHKNPNLVSDNAPSYNTGLSNCKTPNCVGHPGSIQFGIPPTQQFDSKYSSLGSSYNTPSVGTSEGHRPNEFSLGVSPEKPSIYPQGHTFTKPNVQYSSTTTTFNGFNGVPGSVTPHDLKPSNEKQAVYTGGFGGPPGLLKPNEFNIHSNFDTSQAIHPTTSKPSVHVKPNDQEIPTYTGGFGGSSGILKPSEFDTTKAVNTDGTSAHTEISDIKKPIVFGKPNQNSPTYTSTYNELTQTLKPNELSVGHSSVTVNPVSFSHVDQNSNSKPNVDSKPLNQEHPTYTNGFPGTSESLHPNKINVAKPSDNANSEAVAHTEVADFTKPIAFGKPLNQNLPDYAGGLSSPIGVTKPSTLNSGHTPDDVHPEVFPQTTVPTAIKPLKQNLSPYTGGFGGPPGLLNPNEFDVTKPSISVNTETVAHVAKPVTFDKPLVQNLPAYMGGIHRPTGSTTPNKLNNGQPSVVINLETFPQTAHTSFSKPDTIVKPLDQNLPTYTGGFNGPSGLLNELSVVKPSVNVNTETVTHTGLSDFANPIIVDKPTNQHLPTYIGGLSGPIGAEHEFNVPHHFVSSNTGMFPHSGYPFSKPSVDIKPSNQKLPTHLGGFGGPPESSKTSEFISGHPIGDTNAEFKPAKEKLSTQVIGLNKASESLLPNKLDNTYSYTSANNADTEYSLEQKLQTHTDSFGESSKLDKPKKLNADQPPVTISVNSDAITQTEHHAITKPSPDVKPSSEKLPIYIHGFDGPSGTLKPDEFDASHSLVNTNIGTESHTAHFSLANLHEKPNLPTYTSIYGGPSELQKSNDHNTFIPLTNVNVAPHLQTGFNSDIKPSDETVNKVSAESDIGSSHNTPVNSDISSGINSHINMDSETQEHTAQNLSPYAVGLGGSTGLFKPNEFQTSSDSDNKGGVPSQHSESSGLGIDSSSVAKAEAVAYSGGFGGPPGLLKPYDDGKLNSNIHSGKVLLQSEDKYGKIHSNIDSTNVNVGTTSSDSSISGFGTSGAGTEQSNLSFTKGGLENISSAAGLNSDDKSNGAINKGNILTYNKKPNDYDSESQGDVDVPSIAIAQATASASATASATATTLNSDNGQEKTAQVLDNKPKATGGCGGGCGGGTYRGENNFEFGSSLSKPLYFGGWNSGLNAASASVKSTAGALSRARAFSAGGSYASSSAIAHASSGYPTKGGYGK